MALSDPQSVTIDGTANSLPRVSSGANSGSFSTSDGNISLTVSHQYGKRTRRVIRLDHQKVAPDPLFPAQNAPYTSSFYFVMDVPKTGYSVAEEKKIVDGLMAAMSASSGALITKVLGGEN